MNLPLLHFRIAAGATVDGAVKDGDGAEDDALCTLSGSRKRAPYLARQTCRGISAATYGTGRPLVGSTGDVALHKERTSAWQHGKEHTGNLPRFGLPQGVKPYTCFGGLMVEMNVVVRGTLARQGLPQGYGDHKRMVARVCQVSKPLTPSYDCHGPPFID